jgi:anti-anti-sigma factor
VSRSEAAGAITRRQGSIPFWRYSDFNDLLDISGLYYISKPHATIGDARMEMNIVEAANAITHVELDGRLDIAGAQKVDPHFSALAESSKALVVDLTKVSFLASLGVRTLMLSAKTLIRRGADMAVCGANENVEKVLRSTGFDEIVNLYADFTSAAAALRSRAADFSSRNA